MLDQAVGLGLRAREDAEHVAVLVERELGLLGVDHERAAALARVLQRRGGCARGAQRRPPGLGGGLLAGEDAVDALVVQARVGADQRAVEGGAARAPRRAAPARRSPPRARRRAAASRRRWRARAAASARRRRARTRWWRACAPRGRRAEPSGTCAATSAMCTQIRVARPSIGSAEIASSKSRALTGSMVKVGSSRRSRRSPGAHLTRSAAAARLALERRVEAAREAAVEQQPLDHVAGDVGAPEHAHDACAGAAGARGAVHEHQLAGGDLEPAAAAGARGPERQPRAAVPARLARRRARVAGTAARR